MPEEVQLRMLHTVPGLERAEVMRPAYAIEYDCVDPTELLPTLETRKVAGLYGAGQSTAPRATRRPPSRVSARA